MENTRPPGCEGCQKEATIHLTQHVNGVLKKVDMCTSCPNAKKIDDPTGFSLADQLLGIGGPEEMRPARDEKVCPDCGFSEPEFKKSGRLGCPTCYTAFAASLNPLLHNMHPGDRHVGKMPERFRAVEMRRAELLRLQQQLDEAVETEDFEAAARLRDDINSLKAQLQA
jgi:protein arginine kinase activator